MTTRRYLNDAGFGHFDRAVGLSGRLAGQTLDPSGVNLIVEVALAVYDDKVQNVMVSNLMRMKKRDLLECLTPDYPLVEMLSEAGPV